MKRNYKLYGIEINGIIVEVADSLLEVNRKFLKYIEKELKEVPKRKVIDIARIVVVA